jgi:hypothetical protein
MPAFLPVAARNASFLRRHSIVGGFDGLLAKVKMRKWRGHACFARLIMFAVCSM